MGIEVIRSVRLGPVEIRVYHKARGIELLRRGKSGEIFVVPEAQGGILHRQVDLPLFQEGQTVFTATAASNSQIAPGEEVTVEMGRIISTTLKGF